MSHGEKFNSAGRRDPETGAGRVPDELIDAILDGEIDRAGSKEMFEALRRDPEAAGDLNATRRAIGALRAPVEAPDFTDRVLQTVGRKRGGWLSGRDRRWVIGGRIAAAAAVLLVVGGLYTAERARPGTLDLSDEPKVLAGLASSVSDQSARLAADTQQQMVCLGDSAFSVVQMLGVEPGASGATARVVFEWPFDAAGHPGEPARMMVFSEQPITAEALAEHLSSITRQAGEAERTLRAEGTLERFIDRLPVDRKLITTIGDLATGRFLQVSNSPSGGGVIPDRANGRDSMPVIISLPGFGPSGAGDGGSGD